jgi:hypothetical protein
MRNESSASNSLSAYKFVGRKLEVTNSDLKSQLCRKAESGKRLEAELGFVLGALVLRTHPKPSINDIHITAQADLSGGLELVHSHDA